MKNIVYILLLGILLTSCEYDNWDEPESFFTGNLTYNGAPFLYDGNPGAAMLRLYQDGFGKPDPGQVARINENGYFSQLFFSGEYKLTLENTPYPFVLDDFQSLGVGLGYDTMTVDLNTSLNMDFELTPYYTLSNVNAEIVGTDIVATFDVTALEDGTFDSIPNVSRARFYLNTTPIVTGATGVQRSSKLATPFNSGTQQVSVSIAVSKYRKMYVNNFKTYGWYRVALELEGIPNYFLFSEIIKLEGIPLEY